MNLYWPLSGFLPISFQQNIPFVCIVVFSFLLLVWLIALIVVWERANVLHWTDAILYALPEQVALWSLLFFGKRVHSNYFFYFELNFSWDRIWPLYQLSINYLKFIFLPIIFLNGFWLKTQLLEAKAKTWGWFQLLLIEFGQRWIFFYNFFRSSNKFANRWNVGFIEMKYFESSFFEKLVTWRRAN